MLKPRWLVDGIYTILRWLHKRETNGEMRIEDFPSALKDKKIYPEAMHKFLLALMEKFELCFPVEGEEELYLVPALLDDKPTSMTEKVHGPDAQENSVPLRGRSSAGPVAAFYRPVAHVEREAAALVARCCIWRAGKHERWCAATTRGV